MSVFSNLASIMIPKYVADSFTKPKTSYPGASSSPWLPGSNAVPASTSPAASPATSGGVAPGAGTAPVATPKYDNQEQYDAFLQGLDYGIPDVDTISMEDAQARAKAMYAPKREQSILSQDKIASDSREHLAQLLAGTGYANPRGGKRQTGENNITQAQAINNAKINSDFDFNEAAAAQDIYNGEQSRAASQLNSLIAQQNQKNAAQVNVFGMKNSAAWQKEEREDNKYNSFLDFWVKLLSGNPE